MLDLSDVLQCALITCICRWKEVLGQFEDEQNKEKHEEGVTVQTLPHGLEGTSVGLRIPEGNFNLITEPFSLKPFFPLECACWQEL